MNRQLFNAMVAQYGKETVSNNGSDTIEWSGGVHCALPSLKFYGLSEQYGTPTPDSPLPVSAFDGTATVSGRDSYLYTPKLYGIGEYKDEWDYVTGKGVRNVASITLDGVSDGKKALGVALASKTGTYYAIFYIPYKSHHAQFGLLLSSHFKSEWTHSVGTAYVSGSGTYEYRQILAYHTDQTLTTVAQWNAWLKAQYDAGTPVTFYYALEAPQPFEERPSYSPYESIPNEGGVVDIIDSGMNTPFELSYITHSSVKLFKVSEVLATDQADATGVDVTTFTYAQGSSISGKSIRKRSKLSGGRLYVDFDSQKCNRFRCKIFLFDRDGNPYKWLGSWGKDDNGNSAKAFPDAEQSGNLLYVDGKDYDKVNWMPAGSGLYPFYPNAPFSVPIPDGCTVMVEVSADGKSVYPDGTITPTWSSQAEKDGTWSYSWVAKNTKVTLVTTRK